MEREMGPIEEKMANMINTARLRGQKVGRIVMGPLFHRVLCYEMGNPNVRLTHWHDIPIEVTNEAGASKVAIFSGPTVQ